MQTIHDIRAREILDSRGNPTVAVTVYLSDGSYGHAEVPSGASTGVHEALELRDGDPKRYNGKGVLRAVNNVNTTIKKALIGFNVKHQAEIDEKMIRLDGTKNKEVLGANAILGVSMACAAAAANASNMPLYKYLRTLFDFGYGNTFTLPMPVINVINGGAHADSNLDLQEFWIIPVGAKTMAERVRYSSEVFHSLEKILKENNRGTNVGNEGGFACMFTSLEEPLQFLSEAIKRAGYELGKDFTFGMDTGSSEFYDTKTDRYIIKLDNKIMTHEDMLHMYAEWMKKYPFQAIEDPVDQDAWDAWAMATKLFGDKILLVGDDFFVTNKERLAKGIEKGCANAILIKLNQIGSVTETMQTILLAKQHRYATMISHRSGETTDTFIADLAVAVNAEYVKTGSMSRGERICKYNRFLEIEDELSITQ